MSESALKDAIFTPLATIESFEKENILGFALNEPSKLSTFVRFSASSVAMDGAELLPILRKVMQSYFLPEKVMFFCLRNCFC